MLLWLVAITRFIGVVISLGIALGIVWFMGDHSLISFGPPLFLFILSVLPSAKIKKYPIVVILGFVVCILNLLESGIPFVRNWLEADVELLFGLQWVLILFFLSYIYTRRNKKNGSRLMN